MPLIKTENLLHWTKMFILGSFRYFEIQTEFFFFFFFVYLNFTFYGNERNEQQ